MLTSQSALQKDRTTVTRLEHRHFAFIARTIANLTDDIRTDVARHFANHCARTNPRFDRERFLRACRATD